MEPDRASLTALGVAWLRARHYTDHAPHVFADPIAVELIKPSEASIFETAAMDFMSLIDPEFTADSPEEILAEALIRYPAMPGVLARARHSEDRLAQAIESGVVRQLVLVGAGMDTFAQRHADNRTELQVFEIDHPATQAFKVARLDEAGYGRPSNLNFVPADLEKDSVADVLSATSFDRSLPAFFFWHGVTYYLTRPAIEETLRSIHSIAAPGGELCFDYMDTRHFESPSPEVQHMMDLVAGWGEPFISSFEPAALAAIAASIGLEVVEDLGKADLNARFFAGRADGLCAVDLYRSVALRVI